MYNTRYVKYYNTRATLLAGITQRTGSTVIQIGYDNYTATATAKAIRPTPFGPWKGQYF